MIDCEFHETKRERKFYEDKKQKALRYLDHTIEFYDNSINPSNLAGKKDYFSKKLQELRKLVNDI